MAFVCLGQGGKSRDDTSSLPIWVEVGWFSGWWGGGSFLIMAKETCLQY